MTQQGIVRESEAPIKVWEHMPLWMQTVCNHAPSYADFWNDLTKSIIKIEGQIADLLGQGEDDRARLMLGKRDALKEIRYILEAYKKEERNDG